MFRWFISYGLTKSVSFRTVSMKLHHIVFNSRSWVKPWNWDWNKLKEIKNRNIYDVRKHCIFLNVFNRPYLKFVLLQSEKKNVKKRKKKKKIRKKTSPRHYFIIFSLNGVGWILEYVFAYFFVIKCHLLSWTIASWQ